MEKEKGNQEQDERVKRLKKTRSTTKAQITKIYNKVEDKTSKVSEEEAAIRLEWLEEYFIKFRQIQDEIETFVTDLKTEEERRLTIGGGRLRAGHVIFFYSIFIFSSDGRFYNGHRFFSVDIKYW